MEHGRIAWQRNSRYSRRSLVETAMDRCKTIIGRRLHVRILPSQRTEGEIACNAHCAAPRLQSSISKRAIFERYRFSSVITKMESTVRYLGVDVEPPVMGGQLTFPLCAKIKQTV
jgi:hypothetical protein